jgi:integrase
MRRGEIASLRWENVNLKRSVITLPRTKNGEARTVSLSPLAITILKSRPNLDAPRERVFGYTESSITATMRVACEEAKIENLRFHDLRHEATSRLFEDSDLDIMEIRMITGHKTL